MIMAHGAGIDDAAFVVLPLLVIVAVRWLNRRQSPQQDEARDLDLDGMELDVCAPGE
jgi:hypothetical protein